MLEKVRVFFYIHLYVFTFSIFFYFFKICFVIAPLNRVTWSHGATEMLILLLLLSGPDVGEGPSGQAAGGGANLPHLLPDVGRNRP